MEHFDCLIVGAGHGGAQTAIALRARRFAGSIGIVSDETEPPYERPPLSKDYLAGAKPFAEMLIRPEGFWAERAVTLRLGRRIVSLDADAHVAVAEDGAHFGYGSLVWAAGGAPRRLDCPGHDLAGVHAVRTRADADAIAADLAGAESVVVVGGGYIGLETAAVLSKLGRRVTVLEAQDRVLARVAGQALSRFYEAEHCAHGVTVRLGAAVAGLVPGNGRVAGVALADGTVLPAELVIVGIGIVPSVEPLISAGAAGGNGVDVDAFCRTGLPDVWAIGDCARHANAFAGGAAIRLESVQNAADQAMVVAKALTGEPEPYRAVPWFWSNQYDLKLQTVGLSAGHDEAVVRGDPATRRFSVVYLAGGEVRALDCVNAARDYVEGRALVAARARIPADRLADTTVSLKSLLAATAAGERPSVAEVA